MDEQKDVSLESDTEQTNIETEGQDPSDALTPEHPRFKQVIAENHELKGTLEDMKAEMAELRNSIVNKQDSGEETDEEEIALRKIERRMEEKFAKKEDLSADRQALQFDRLSEKYNGSNGYPKFVPVDVVAYAKRNGFGSNYESAYKQMHFDTIVSVEASRKGKIEVPTSERPTGGERSTESTTLTPQDISKMSDEEYLKNRDKILNAIKP
jgi:predicted RNase H-like nuclease (RuvC/YqgF family)